MKSTDSKWEYSARVRNMTNKAYLMYRFGANSSFLLDDHLQACSSIDRHRLRPERYYPLKGVGRRT
jgi:hypothetical protein